MFVYLFTENQQLMNEWRDAFRFEIDRFNMKSPGKICVKLIPCQS